MDSCELTAVITAIANLLSQQYDDNELSLLVAVFSQLSTTIATILVNKSICEGQNSDTNLPSEIV